MDKFQISINQIPNKSQTSINQNSKEVLEALGIGVWLLDIIWNLRFVYCDFKFQISKAKFQINSKLQQIKFQTTTVSCLVIEIY